MEIVVTRDNFERIRNKFCRALHILVLPQLLMVQNYTVAVRIGRIFDAKTGTTMQAFHRSKPDFKYKNVLSCLINKVQCIE